MIYVINKDVKEIQEMDLHDLIDNEVIETKILDYKGELPANSISDKKEFLADVSSFANASGGDIIFGINEDRDTGKPQSPLEGINIQNVDSEISRLENILYHGLEPQIPSYLYNIWPIELSNSNIVIIIRIMKSWIGPHRIGYNDIHRFYSRNSNGKYMMDVQELRAAFILSESLGEKIKSFREKRLLLIIAGESHVQFNHNEILILHLIPWEAFELGKKYDISNNSLVSDLKPVHSSSSPNFRYNIDGLLTYDKFERRSPFELTYAQLYHNGIIEAAEDYIFQIPKEQGKKIIPFTDIEVFLINTLPNYINVYRKLGINPPILITLNIFGVRGWGYPSRLVTTYPIDRDHLQPPDILLEDYDEKTHLFLKPIFDSLWNACGFKHSPNYDSDGNWRRNPML